MVAILIIFVFASASAPDEIQPPSGTLLDAASVPSLEHPERFGENNLLDFMFTDRAK